MTKSIIPGKDVFQYAIRYLPNGKYLKKTQGSSFHETNIPSLYNSPKVAKTSLENNFRYYHRHDPKDCEIVKFRLYMEEVKEPTASELAFEKDLAKLNLARKVAGEIHWEEVESERGKSEIFSFVRHMDNMPVSEGNSLHCRDKVYKTGRETYQFLWSEYQSLDEIPMSISRAVDYNWDDKIQELKTKHGIS